MSMSLAETFREARNRVRELDDTLKETVRHCEALGPEEGARVIDILESFRKRTASCRAFEEALYLMEVRAEAGSQVLDRLRSESQEEDRFRQQHSGPKAAEWANLRDARRILVFQAWVAAAWSCYDLATEFLLSCLLEDQGGKQPRGSEFPDVLSGTTEAGPTKHNRTRLEQRLGIGLVSAAREGYAWAVCLCYEIRNRLLHAGGWSENRQMFQRMPEDGFTLDDEDYKALVERCATRHRVTRAQCRRPDGWPPTKDLRVIFEECLADADACMSLLIEWAVGQLQTQVELALKALGLPVELAPRTTSAILQERDHGRRE